MPKDVIGSAYVRIVAMSQDFEKQVQASFDRLKPMAEKSGEESSKAWTDGFQKHFGQTMADAHERVQQDLRDSWDKAGTDHGKDYGDSFGDSSHDAVMDGHDATTETMGASWSAAGAKHGKEYGDPFSVEVDRAMGRSVDNSTNLWRGSNLMKFPLEAIEKLSDDMPNILGRGADRSGVRIVEVFANVGQGISRSLSDAFGGGGDSKIFKWMTDGADAARASLSGLITLGETLGSAMVGLVVAVANAASGLFALVSAASAAAPALAVIPGLIAAIAQAGITLLVGFSGVGKAISAGMKDAAASTGTASARSRELASAQRAVESASRSLQSAEKASAKAKKDLAEAQKGLNDAYKEGAKQLRDIQYAAEDAALQEERAAINLANARDELERTKATNPADSRAVQEAELAYKEADLAYREARSRNKDASEEANDATKKGVKGTQAVTSAQDRLTRAQENVIASNQRVADSQRALADAQQRLADTQSGAVGSAAAYNKALEKFGPQGQKFIKTVVGMRGSFKGLREAAGESIFAALTASLNKLVRGPFFGILQRNFKETSKVLAGLVTQITDVVTSAENMSAIDRIMKSNTKVIGSFSGAADNMVDALIAITDAARPLTEEFARWLSGKVVKWSTLITASRDAGTLQGKLEKGAVVARQLGRIFHNLGTALFNTGKAASSGGKMILDATEKASKKWSDWTASATGKGSLKTYFENVAKGFVPLMEGINAVVKALLKLGGNTDTVIAVADGLKAVAKVIGPIGDQVNNTAPLFSEFATQMGKIFSVLQESGSLQGFAKVMTIAATAVAKFLGAIVSWDGNIAGWDGLKKIFGDGFDGKKLIFFAGAITGVLRGLSLLKKGFEFLFKGTIGKSIGTITTAFGGIKRLLAGESIFGGAKKSSEEARKEFIKQMKVDKLKKEAMEGVGEGAKLAAKHIGDSTKESKKARAAKIGERVKKGVGAARAGVEDLRLGKSGRADKRLHEVLDRIGPSPFDEPSSGASAAKSRRSRLTGAVRSRLASGGDAGFLDVSGFRRPGAKTDDSGTPKARRSRSIGKGLGRGLAIGGAALGGVGLAVGALAAVATLNKDSAAALGKQITDMAKNLPVALSALAGQIPSILSSIAGAIGPLINTIAAALPGVIQSLVKAIPTVINAIMGALPKVFDAIVKVIPVLLGAFTKLLPMLLNALTTALPKIIGVVIGIIPVIIKALAKALPIVIKALAKALPLVIKAITGAIPLIIKAIVTALPQIIGAIAEALPLIVGAIGDAIPQIIDAVIEAVPLIVTAIVQALPAIWEALKALVPAVWKAITEAIPKILGALQELIGAIVKWIQDNGPTILTKLGEWTSQFVSWVGDLISKLPGMLAGVISAVWSWITENGPKLLVKLGEWTLKFVGWVAGLIVRLPIELGKLWLKIAGWVAGIALKIPGAVAGWITAFLGWIGGVVSKIPGKLAEIWTSISTWISKLPSKISSAASGMWDGFATAFKGALNWIIRLWNNFGFELKVPDEVPLIGGRGISFSTPNIPLLAAGGTVLAQPGGVLARIAEAGRNEVVKPLDNKGLTASDRAIMSMIQEQGRLLSELVTALVPRNARTGLTPAVASTAATAAVVATQRTLSTQGGSTGATAPELVTAINHLTDSVDSLQRPLVGGDINVQSAPGERADVSVPAMLRRRAYTRPGAR